MGKLTWFGHSAFKLEYSGGSVIIDPFFSESSGLNWKEALPVDMVLVTHDHGDHVGSTVDICRHSKAMLGTIVGTAQALRDRGVPADQILNGIGYNIGGTLSWKGISATMTQAFHSSDSGAPTGFIIKMPDMPVFYHAGDTGIFPGMELLAKLYNIEVALLPMGGVFTMDAFQAAHSCRLLGCKKVAPMHWGTFPVLAQSTQEFRELLAKICPTCECLDLTPGRAFDI